MKDTRTQIHSLYTDHSGWLTNWLYSRLGCIQDACDLTQDTFVRVLCRPAPPENIRKPRSWLSVIAKGLLIDHFRRKSVESAYLNALSLMPESLAPSPENRLVLMEAIARIDAALDGISPKARKAFILSRLGGQTYVQIAATLNVSLSSVEKYMATAVRHCLKVSSDN